VREMNPQPSMITDPQRTDDRWVDGRPPALLPAEDGGEFNAPAPGHEFNLKLALLCGQMHETKVRGKASREMKTGEAPNRGDGFNPGRLSPETAQRGPELLRRHDTESRRVTRTGLDQEIPKGNRFGVPLQDGTDGTYVTVAAVRDLSVGILALAFALLRDRRAMGLIVLLGSIIPIGDGIVVLLHSPTPLEFLPLHWGGAVGCLIFAFLLMRRP
jgi:Domain of unknown function (DUF4267)